MEKCFQYFDITINISLKERPLKILWKNFEGTLKELWKNFESALKELWKNFGELWKNIERTLKELWSNFYRTLKGPWNILGSDLRTLMKTPNFLKISLCKHILRFVDFSCMSITVLSQKTRASYVPRFNFGGLFFDKKFGL